MEGNASRENSPPRGEIIAGSDGNVHVTGSDGVSLNVGAGECQPECPESGLSAAASCRGNDLQWEAHSPPVENEISNQSDTHNMHVMNKGKGQGKKLMRPNVTTKNLKVKEKVQILGYVPVQIANLSLEEIELKKYSEVGVASPIVIDGERRRGTYDVSPVTETSGETVQDFDNYLKGKLAPLTDKERCTLEPVLRRYKHLFYGLGSRQVGCASQVEHAIDTGDARPIKRNPYGTPHALKPIVEGHIEDMLENNIIEPSMSPWSSSIVLVQKKN